MKIEGLKIPFQNPIDSWRWLILAREAKRVFGMLELAVQDFKEIKKKGMLEFPGEKCLPDLFPEHYCHDGPQEYSAFIFGSGLRSMDWLERLELPQTAEVVHQERVDFVHCDERFASWLKDIDNPFSSHYIGMPFSAILKLYSPNLFGLKRFLKGENYYKGKHKAYHLVAKRGNCVLRVKGMSGLGYDDEHPRVFRSDYHDFSLFNKDFIGFSEYCCLIGSENKWNIKLTLRGAIETAIAGCHWSNKDEAYKEGRIASTDKIDPDNKRIIYTHIERKE